MDPFEVFAYWDSRRTGVDIDNCVVMQAVRF